MDKRNELQKDFRTENVKYLKKNKRGYNDIAMRMGKIM